MALDMSIGGGLTRPMAQHGLGPGMCMKSDIAVQFEKGFNCDWRGLHPIPFAPAKRAQFCTVLHEGNTRPFDQTLSTRG
jgi:hypothetical protein